MPISSYIGNRSRGNGWSRSFLPTTFTSSSSSLSSSPKSKIPRKSRRRFLLKDFIQTHFFTFSLLSLSLLLFFAALLHFAGTPFSLSFSTPPRRKSVLRKTFPRRPPSDGVVSSAAVDVTTKDLYDTIEFTDVDGGPWKQGWRVNYKGNEWDFEKLKIFVVPHSHNDPGWKLTVEEYYERQSRNILDTIVDSLSKIIRVKNPSHLM